jgi:hypothetical protein
MSILSIDYQDYQDSNGLNGSANNNNNKVIHSYCGQSVLADENVTYTSPGLDNITRSRLSLSI